MGTNELFIRIPIQNFSAKFGQFVMFVRCKSQIWLTQAHLNQVVGNHKYTITQQHQILIYFILLQKTPHIFILRTLNAKDLSVSTKEKTITTQVMMLDTYTT